MYLCYNIGEIVLNQANKSITRKGGIFVYIWYYLAMIFTPKNKKPEDILSFIGFTPCNEAFGYELPLYNPNRTTPPDINCNIPRRRFHAYIRDGSIDFHQDRPSRGTHKAHNFGGQITNLYYIFQAIDENKDFTKLKGYKYIKIHARFNIKV